MARSWYQSLSLSVFFFSSSLALASLASWVWPSKPRYVVTPRMMLSRMKTTRKTIRTGLDFGFAGMGNPQRLATGVGTGPEGETRTERTGRADDGAATYSFSSVKDSWAVSMTGGGQVAEGAAARVGRASGRVWAGFVILPSPPRGEGLGG